jgi:hypothetical protein
MEFFDDYCSPDWGILTAGASDPDALYDLSPPIATELRIGREHLKDTLFEVPERIGSIMAPRTFDISSFDKAIIDPKLMVNPRSLGFIPSSYWTWQDVRFGEVVADFFRRKNSANCRFIHKLYNALLLTTIDAAFVPLVGILWVSDTILKVNRQVFAKLLGIKAIDGSLFHQQGNFPSHGFVEVEPALVRQMFPDFDFSTERLMMHAEGKFVRGCTEDDVTACRWRQ